jgi:hypothetical protein
MLTRPDTPQEDRVQQLKATIDEQLTAAKQRQGRCRSRASRP